MFKVYQVYQVYEIYALKFVALPIKVYNSNHNSNHSIVIYFPYSFVAIKSTSKL
jgi:hypothetical protein